MKKIFINLLEDVKLNLVVHNKNLQKILNLNIIDFKRFSGKYIIGERNGYGKEYDGYLKKIIFEGEYLNGKKNGKGKEYDDNGKLIFEGYYLNGEINGKEKEYYANGKLKYEGEYLNGEINEKGKEYYANGKLKYEGEYLNGKNGMEKLKNITNSVDYYRKVNI